MPTISVTREIDFSINEDSFEEIVLAASHLAVWQQECQIEYDEDNDCIIAVIQSEGESYTLNADRLERAAAVILINEKNTGFGDSARTDLLQCIENDEPDEIDADTADQLAQVACFGEVVYA